MEGLKVSPADQGLLQHRWYLVRGYVTRWDAVAKRPMSMHREILCAPRGSFVDHINGDKLDNRRENLRTCTHAQNMRNRRMHKNNRTGFPNVYFDARRASFTAQVRAEGKKRQRYGFASAEAAFEAAKQMLAEMHGEYAKTSGVLA